MQPRTRNGAHLPQALYLLDIATKSLKTQLGPLDNSSLFAFNPHGPPFLLTLVIELDNFLHVFVALLTLTTLLGCSGFQPLGRGWILSSSSLSSGTCFRVCGLGIGLEGFCYRIGEISISHHWCLPQAPHRYLESLADLLPVLRLLLKSIRLDRYDRSNVGLSSVYAL